MDLRSGINPQQAAAVVPMRPGRWPFRVLQGVPSYINLLDALNGWQLVSEASRELDRPVAASYKHVSPAGVAVAGPVDDLMAELYGVESDEGSDPRGSTVTSAYLRARDADPRSSYGDFVAVSHPVDSGLARLLTRVVCDGIIAPGYAPGTMGLLGTKRNGRFVVLEADETFPPPLEEAREVFGVRLSQRRDPVPISRALLGDVVHGPLPGTTVDDLLLGLTVLRSTQSNSVCYVRHGVTLGIGAGQQSRIDCTRLAGAKADTWWLRRHPAVRALRFRPGVRRQDRINWQIRYVEGDLTAHEHARLSAALVEPLPPLAPEDRKEWLERLDDVAFVSDGALPFRDNIDQARRHGVTAVAEPGGSVRSPEVEAACLEHGIVLVRTGLRLFHH